MKGRLRKYEGKIQNKLKQEIFRIFKKYDNLIGNGNWISEEGIIISISYRKWLG